MVRDLESARKDYKTIPHGGKQKSLNAVMSSTSDEKITAEIRELKELLLGINRKVEELKKKTAERASAAYPLGRVACYTCCQRGYFSRDCPSQPGKAQSQVSGNGLFGLRRVNQTPTQ